MKTEYTRATARPIRIKSVCINPDAPFGEQLRKIRLANGVSVTNLGKQMGLFSNQICTFEKKASKEDNVTKANFMLRALFAMGVQSVTFNTPTHAN